MLTFLTLSLSFDNNVFRCDASSISYLMCIPCFCYYLLSSLTLIVSYILGWLTNRQLEGDTAGYAPVSGQLLDQRLLHGGLPPRRGYRDSMISIDGAGMCKYFIFR